MSAKRLDIAREGNIKLPAVSSQKSENGAGHRRPASETQHSVAWEDSGGEPDMGGDGAGDSAIPTELWNNLVARQVPGANPKRLGRSMRGRSGTGESQPFSRTRTRSFKANSIDNIAKQLDTLRPKSVPAGHGVHGMPPLAGGRETPLPLGLQGHAGTSSREAALLLVQSFDDLQRKIRESLGGDDPDRLAREAAEAGDAEGVMAVLEPSIFAVDMVMGELVKQVQVECWERGELLERSRRHFLAMFAHAATALQVSQGATHGLRERAESLQGALEPLREEHALTVQRVAALGLELQVSLALALALSLALSLVLSLSLVRLPSLSLLQVFRIVVIERTFLSRRRRRARRRCSRSWTRRSAASRRAAKARRPRGRGRRRLWRTRWRRPTRSTCSSRARSRRPKQLSSLFSP
jgi:hypothetical protein